MTVGSVRPLSLSLCLVHHPGSNRASGLRSQVYKHYRRDPQKNLGEGGLGLEVEYRSEPAGLSSLPIPIDFDRSQVTAVLAVCDEDLAGDPALADYVASLAASATPIFPRATFLAIATDEKGMRLAQSGPAGSWQTLDARAWPEEQFTRRLFTAVDHHLCRLLNAYLEHVENPGANPATLRRAFARKAQVFLSHSKHDPDQRGENTALALKAALADMSTETFFDAIDLPPGTPWEQAIDDAAGGHALVAILTDSYSSRTYCKREVLAAKRAGMPIVVADCLADYEARGFPYAGNAPVVQMLPDLVSRQHQLIGRLFDELLRNLVWRCNTVRAKLPQGVRFHARAPELVTLAYIERDLADDGSGRPLTIVYPGAPVGAEEEELFAIVAPERATGPLRQLEVGVRHVTERFLANMRIGVSVSNSPNLAQLGLAPEHVEDNLVEITRYLVAAGAKVVYGGDLRANGFTELLIEVVARHQVRDDRSTRFESVLAWPVHMRMTAEALVETTRLFAPVGALILLAENGDPMSMPERMRSEGSVVAEASWGPSLTAMRRMLASRCDARIAVGGATAGYKGDMPGIAEEVLLSIAAGKPTFVAGALGGCALDIGLLSGLATAPVGISVPWPGQEGFADKAYALNPGLHPSEARALASPVLGTEMLILLLKGLRSAMGELGTKIGTVDGRQLRQATPSPRNRGLASI